MDTKVAVLFDMDGTLVDNAVHHDLAWKEFCRRYHRPPFDLKDYFGNTNQMFFAHVFGRELSASEVDRYAIEKETIYQQLFEADIREVTGLTQFLQDLTQNQITIGLATAAPRMNVDFVFNRLGINRYFKFAVDDSMAKRGKPHPDIYLKAAEMAQLPPNRCVAIEDSINGILSAKAAGMKVVAVLTTHSQDEIGGADMYIRDFTEISTDAVRRLIG